MAIDPEYQLDSEERTYIAMLAADTPAFAALQKIFESEIAKFHVSLVNSKTDEEVLINHKLEKAASQFYVQVLRRINQEIEIHYNAPKVDDKPVDDTEGLIDFGDSVEETHDGF